MILKIHHLDSQHAIVTLGAVVIRIIESARTDREELEHLAGLCEAILERHSVAGMWVVVHHGAPIPDAAVRRYAGQLFRPHKDRLSVVYSMLGLGFWSSAAIAATRALTSLMGVRAPIETSVEGGAHRLSQDLIGMDPAKLVSTHHDLLQRMHSKAAVA